MIFMASPALASEAPPLKARVEAGMKLGSERSVVMTEVWAPLRQWGDGVLYVDARFMGDDADNREGNFGVGWRQMRDERTVVGLHGWVDRRRTDRGSDFTQVTLGGEVLGEQLDVRVNGYAPLSSEKKYATPNTGSSTPYLANTGIFYDTSGVSSPCRGTLKSARQSFACRARHRAASGPPPEARA